MGPGVTFFSTIPPLLLSYISSSFSDPSNSVKDIKKSNPQLIEVSLSFNANTEGGIPLREFYRKLNDTLLRETKELRHPVIKDFDTSSWPDSIRAFHRGPKHYILEKSFVIQKYELAGAAHLGNKGGNWLESKPSEVARVRKIGHHGSVHSAFVNGSLGASLTGIYAGVYSKGLQPLPWKDPLANITFSQVAPRVLQRMSLFFMLCMVGGYGVDYSSQIIEQYRRKTDGWNQVIGSAAIGGTMSLLVNRRELRRSLASAGIFSSLTFVHYLMDTIAAKKKGVTNGQFYY